MEMHCDDRILEFGLPYMLIGKAMRELLKYNLWEEHSISKINPAFFILWLK